MCTEPEAYKSPKIVTARNKGKTWNSYAGTMHHKKNLVQEEM